MSQQLLATRAGISIPRLAEAEKFGIATPATLAAIAKVLDVPVATLEQAPTTP